MSSVMVSGLSKRFGSVDALHATSLSIDHGEFVVIVGPSGCGKSTLLRLVAGLDEPSSGSIVIGERDVTRFPPAERGLAMVFQSYALYPHLSVFENIAFPLRVARRPRAEIGARVRATADMLDLGGLLERRPRALSGGQRQRVSIARAVVREPAVLLLDEPLSNLDAELRSRMRYELARLHGRLGCTMIYVTHDQTEAMTLANRVVVMAQGRVEQAGPPLDVYNRPASLAVARAIGAPAMNFLAGTVETVDAAGVTVRLTEGEQVRVAARAEPGAAVTLGVRPEHLRPAEHGPFGGAVELFERLGPLSFVHLGRKGEDGGAAVVAQLPGDRMVTLGEQMRFAVDPADARLFATDGRACPPIP